MRDSLAGTEGKNGAAAGGPGATRRPRRCAGSSGGADPGCVPDRGHLASNLGSGGADCGHPPVFDTSRDRLVFDVGHQCYIHKMLTGRREEMAGLRQYGGIAGFPKPGESVHDAFIAGHASNSVAVAVGMVQARAALGQGLSGGRPHRRREPSPAVWPMRGCPTAGSADSSCWLS